MIISMLSNKMAAYVMLLSLVVSFFFLISYCQMKYNTNNASFLEETNKSFECGFNQFEKCYSGFCVQFIKTALLFLLVDLEIALLLPFFVNIPFFEKEFMTSSAIISFISLILLSMLLIEMSMGGLKWQEEN